MRFPRDGLSAQLGYGAGAAGADKLLNKSDLPLEESGFYSLEPVAYPLDSQAASVTYGRERAKILISPDSVRVTTTLASGVKQLRTASVSPARASPICFVWLCGTPSQR